MVLCIQKHLPTHMLPFISKGPQSEENSTESQNLTMKKKLDARYYKKKKKPYVLKFTVRRKIDRSTLERGKGTFSRLLENTFQSKQSQQLPQTLLPRWIQYKDVAQLRDRCVFTLRKLKQCYQNNT